MYLHWSRRLARTLSVCACITALATAGASADVPDKGDEPIEELKCSNIPLTGGPVPVELMERCGSVVLEPRAPEKDNLVPRGPIVVQEVSQRLIATTSVAGITTLSSFGLLVPDPSISGNFPADIEILLTDPAHAYQLISNGAVSRYNDAGVNTPVGTVVPIAGHGWSDMAVDPTTGNVYAISSPTASCTTTTLSQINLLTGTSTPIGVVQAACIVGLAADNAGNLWAHNISTDVLVSVNKVTGLGTTVGPLGFDGNFGQSFDCDPDSGTCYLFAFNATAFQPQLRSVNLATGASTLLGVIGQTAPGGTLQAAGAVFGTVGVCTTDANCNDGNLCNGVETCVSGQCNPGTPVVCDDGEFCTIDSCVPSTGACTTAPNPCSDGDPCTIDSCSGNACQHDGAGVVQFCNTTPTVINASGAATPYPSTISVSGLNSVGSVCGVSLRSLSHTFPDDVDIMLAGPAGGAQNAVLMSDVGGSLDVVAVDLAFSDTAAASLPDATQIVSGTFKPTNIGAGDVFPAPAPASGAASLAVFDGINPNGTWSLFITDDLGGDGGSLGAWCVSIVAPPCDDNTDCDDGNACNGAETCNAGTCESGTPVNCDDGQFCTVDSCVPATGACVYTPNPCSDGNGCTADTCDENTDSCSHALRPTTQFCSTGAITIPSSGAGIPYPSSVSVAGLSQDASLCSVDLRGLTHTFPSDIDILLVGPAGGAQNSVIMSDAGSSFDVVGIDLNLKDSAAAPLPAAQLVSGTFRPTNIGFAPQDPFPAPAPAAAPGAASLAVFDGINPNGTWNLFLVDDAGGDLGSLSNWCLNVIVNSCASDADCNDSNACNGIETCVNTECVPGTPVDCSDGDPCTDDTCVPADGSCTYAPTNCDDGNLCTFDFCDSSTGCQSDNRCTVFCNTGAITLTDSTTPPTVASPYPSSISVTVPFIGLFELVNVRLNGLVHTFPDDIDALLVAPSGANAIIMSDVGGGGDVNGINLVLNDGAPVLPDAGPLVSGTFSPNNVNPGTGTEAWPAPAPAPTGDVLLSTFSNVDPNGTWSLFFVDDQSIDGGSLNGGWCLEVLAGCAVDADCEDGNPCTINTCNEGQCESAPNTCDDDNACTDDSCDTTTGCVNAPNTDPCDDGSVCTDGDTCGGGSCIPGTPIVCDDSNFCTDDTCDAVNGCVYTPNSNPCDDGDACTSDDTCTGGACEGTPTPVNEPNPRTNGYWKRLCQGPHSGDELTADDAACVASLGTTFGDVASVADICAVLQQGGQGGTCAHTEIDLMSLSLNICHLRVCPANAIDSQYSGNGSVGENYTQADGILSDPDRDQASCLLAKGLLEEVNTGRALNLDTVAFAKITGGGVRVSWQAPYSINPVKYNVWRRAAGSLAPFAKIGETTTPSFDDTTVGNFEYDVTPVIE